MATRRDPGPGATEILDEFTELENVDGVTFRSTHHAKSLGGRGPFRFFEGTWGALKDLINAEIVNGCDIRLWRGTRQLLIRPFVKIGTQDRYVANILNQFPGLINAIDYERHGLKYSASFTDTNGVVRGIGFDFIASGGVVVTPTSVTYRWLDATGTIQSWAVPAAIVSVSGFNLFMIIGTPLFKPQDPEWRPYRQGAKIRIDLAPTPGKHIEIDPVASFTTVNTVNGTILWAFPSEATATAWNSGTNYIGTTGGVPFNRFNMYDRFDITSLDASAILTAVKYIVRAETVPYYESGGPDNAVWRIWMGWNILADPLVVGSFHDVKNQSGRQEYDFDDPQIQSTGSKAYITVEIPLPIALAWIRQGGGTEIHDVEVEDRSAYSGLNWRFWQIQESPTEPVLEITYTAPSASATGGGLIGSVLASVVRLASATLLGRGLAGALTASVVLVGTLTATGRGLAGSIAAVVSVVASAVATGRGLAGSIVGISLSLGSATATGRGLALAAAAVIALGAASATGRGLSGATGNVVLQASATATGVGQAQATAEEPETICEMLGESAQAVAFTGVSAVAIALTGISAQTAALTGVSAQTVAFVGESAQVIAFTGQRSCGDN